MTEKNFLTVSEVAEILCVSESYAYKVMSQLNRELKDMGYWTVSGRVNSKYFYERTCYQGNDKN